MRSAPGHKSLTRACMLGNHLGTTLAASSNYYGFILIGYSVEAQKMVRAGYPSVGLIPFPRTGRSVEMSEPESPELPKRFFGLKHATGNDRCLRTHFTGKL